MSSPAPDLRMARYQWMRNGFGAYHTLVHALEAVAVRHYGWALRVADFEEPIAKQWGALADSEVAARLGRQATPARQMDIRRPSRSRHRR